MNSGCTTGTCCIRHGILMRLLWGVQPSSESGLLALACRVLTLQQTRWQTTGVEKKKSQANQTMEVRQGTARPSANHHPQIQASPAQLCNHFRHEAGTRQSLHAQCMMSASTRKSKHCAACTAVKLHCNSMHEDMLEHTSLEQVPRGLCRVSTLRVSWSLPQSFKLQGGCTHKSPEIWAGMTSGVPD